jgi:hypothetical protein
MKSRYFLLPLFLLGPMLSFSEAAPDKDDERIPTPSCDRVDYSKPDAYLFLNNHFGSREQIMKAAAQIKGKTPEEKLVAIYQWVNSHLAYKADYFNEWRTFDQMLRDGVQGGCAQYSVVFGALTRACGIPTVWVKTLDAEWIRGFRTRGTEGSWNGHVFLEIYIHGRWMLLDDTQLVLYKEYNPKTRILPGSRYAYDKGGDPYELILSARWELWKKQVRAYFAHFDLSKLPVGEGANLLTGTVMHSGSSQLKYPAVFVFFSEKDYGSERHLGKILYPKLTHHYTSRFHTTHDYEEQFAKNIQPGATIILLLTGDAKDAVPPQFADLLPKPWAEITSEVAEKSSVHYKGTARKLTVITLAAKNTADLTKQIEKISW